MSQMELNPSCLPKSLQESILPMEEAFLKEVILEG